MTRRHYCKGGLKKNSTGTGILLEFCPPKKPPTSFSAQSNSTAILEAAKFITSYEQRHWSAESQFRMAKRTGQESLGLKKKRKKLQNVQVT